ncbi:MAG: RibD family protein [Cyanobacteria bacterium P01_G01_bin.38]
MAQESDSSALTHEKFGRPQVIAVLAMSVDGKIGDVHRSAARFGSRADQHHLETCVAQADATLFGAGTLRAYGTTLSVRDRTLQQQRQQRGQPAQPIQIVCSASGGLDPGWRFFSQPVPRWLLTTEAGAYPWQGGGHFERILIAPFQDGFDWWALLTQLKQLGIAQLLAMGGGELLAALLAVNAIDELYLTICPLLLGGKAAPTPIDGVGFLATQAPRLQLISVDRQGDEVFLHYRRHGGESEVTLP